ncbi:hypothetical protein PGT21_007713 [Puccinia graminis f. sp. tritici]|uniref:Tyr recombinase domain-containing protein n=1 Tax=Puccinia graminis f. sp. tritici TaxID=56615 RepID=A0A5B0NXK7_PUCGR|nr:hypothetical protein PGTUg99_034587 [Puccinia graminis f. sp. tritici]KAA1094047.1 hypothetical protein PGT21_007713 [Puccinia graminis f. sp. tritici]
MRGARAAQSSARLDANVPSVMPKKPVMLWHLMLLFTNLFAKSDFNSALADLCILSFWGLARLSELTYATKSGALRYDCSVLTTEVIFSNDTTLGRTAAITIRSAKTAAPGETQFIVVSEQPHILCPIRALDRRLATSGGGRTSLFGYGPLPERRHLTRRKAVARIQEVLLGNGEERLTGHSFRVGGVSFWHAIGMSAPDLQKLGRWSSRCYLLYIKTYSKADGRRTVTLLRSLVRNWNKMT